MIRVTSDGDSGAFNQEEVIEIGTEQAQQLLELEGTTVELLMDSNTDLSDAAMPGGYDNKVQIPGVVPGLDYSVCPGWGIL